jgi:hypothetical protein
VSPYTAGPGQSVFYGHFTFICLWDSSLLLFDTTSPLIWTIFSQFSIACLYSHRSPRYSLLTEFSNQIWILLNF